MPFAESERDASSSVERKTQIFTADRSCSCPNASNNRRASGGSPTLSHFGQRRIWRDPIIEGLHRDAKARLGLRVWKKIKSQIRPRPETPRAAPRARESQLRLKPDGKLPRRHKVRNTEKYYFPRLASLPSSIRLCDFRRGCFRCFISRWWDGD